jgi:hypothetical protein
MASELQKLESQIELSAKDISSKVDSINTTVPTAVKDRILDNFHVEGVVAVTREDLNSRLELYFSKLEKKFESFSVVPHSISNSNFNVDPNRPHNENQDVDPERRFTLVLGNQRIFSRTPQEWVMPTVDCKTLWYLWHFGNENDKICAYKKFDEMDLKRVDSITQKPCRKQATKYYHGQYVMNYIDDIAKRNGYYNIDHPQHQSQPQPQDFNLSPVEFAEIRRDRIKMGIVFDKSFQKLLQILHPNSIPPKESSLSFTTIRNKISDFENKNKPVVGTIVQVLEGMIPPDH